MPDQDEHQKQVDDNYDAFQKRLPDLLSDYRGKFALMHNGEIVELFDTHRDAYMTGLLLYKDYMFSLQEITDKAKWFSRDV